MYSQFLHLRPNCQTPIQAWETLNPNMSHVALLLSLSLLKRWCTQMYHDSSWQNLTIQQSEWWLACDPWAHMMVMAPPPPPSLPTRLDGSHHTLSSHPFPKHCYLGFQIFQCRQNIIYSDNFGVPSQLSWFLPGVSKIFLLWFYSNWDLLSVGQFQMVDQNLWAIWIFWLRFFHSCSLVSAIISLIFLHFWPSLKQEQLIKGPFQSFFGAVSFLLSQNNFKWLTNFDQIE